MTVQRIAALILATCVVLGFAGAAGAVNFVQNGDFETIGQARSRQISINGPNGSEQYLPSWTNGTAAGGQAGYNFYVTSGTADLDLSTHANDGIAIQTNDYGYLAIAGPGNGVANGFVGSPTGGTFVMADGDFLVAPISQTIAGLIVGQSYNLAFDWSGGQQKNYRGANTEWWEVGFGGATQSTASVTIAEQGFSGWQHADMTFVATSGTQLLSFLAHGAPNGEPPMLMLDGISLNGPAVPEPATWATMLVGFGAIGATLRYRRRQAAHAR